MKNYKYLFLFLFTFMPNKYGFAQYNYPNYNIQPGNYNDCINDKFQVSLPGLITSEYNSSSTHINFDLLPSLIRSDREIKLNPGISVKADCNLNSSNSTKFEIYTPNAICPVVIMNSLTGKIPLHSKIELGVHPEQIILDKIDDFFRTIHNPIVGQINPYDSDSNDPDFIEVQANFTAPSGANHYINGFYYRDYTENPGLDDWIEIPTDYPFRIRFSPDEIGVWDVKVSVNAHAYVKGYSIDQHCSSLPVNCISNPGNFGLLEVGLHKQTLRFHDNGQSFFAVGQNLGFPHSAQEGSLNELIIPLDFKKHRDDLINLALNGGNYTRIDCDNISYGIEWEHLNKYDSYDYVRPSFPPPTYPPLHRNRQENAWELDRIVDLAEQNNIYLQLMLDNSWDYNPNIGFWDPRFIWQNNCYHNDILSQSSQSDGSNIFTDPTAIKMYKRRLQYTFARWGYSVNVADFELMDEVSNIDNINLSHSQLFFNIMYDYVRNTLNYNNAQNYKNLISVSYAATPPSTILLNDATDILDIHNYGRDKNINYEMRTDIHNTALSWPITRPFIMGEMGFSTGQMEACSPITFHNAIWSTSFMGGLGSGLNWWIWDDNSYRSNVHDVAQFFNGIDFESNFFSPIIWRNTSRWSLVFGGIIYGEAVDYVLENYELKNLDRTRAMGWVHNATAWWANLPDPNIISNNCNQYLPTIAPWEDDGYSSVQQISSTKKWKIRGLKAWRLYRLDVFNIPTNQLISTSSMGSNIFGELNPKCRSLFSNSANNDYTWKCYRTGSNFRLSSEAIENDTLECNEDSVEVNTIYGEDSLGLLNYQWIVNDTVNYYGQTPTIQFNFSGSYDVKLIVSDNNNWIDTLEQLFIKPACTIDGPNKLSNGSTEKNIENNINIYPNPILSTANISISFDYENCTVNLYDLYSEVLLKKYVNNKHEFSLDLANIPAGIYFIEFIFSNQRCIKKIVIQK